MCKHDNAVSLGIAWLWCPTCGSAKNRRKKQWLKPKMRGRTDEPIRKNKPKNH